MATQKEWELETRVKRLEGDDLQALVDDYNKKIDLVFNEAIVKLDDLYKECQIKRLPVTLMDLLDPFNQRLQAGLQSSSSYESLLCNRAAIDRMGMSNHYGIGLSGLVGQFTQSRWWA